jgi:hypothetical protein
MKSQPGPSATLGSIAISGTRIVAAVVQPVGPGGGRRRSTPINGLARPARLAGALGKFSAPDREMQVRTRLAAGGNKIRTTGPAQGAGRRHRVGSRSRRFSVGGGEMSPLETLVVSRGTDGSNPAPSSRESANHRFLWRRSPSFLSKPEFDQRRRITCAKRCAPQPVSTVADLLAKQRGMQDVLGSEGGHCARCPSNHLQGAPRDPKRCRARFAFVCLLRDQGGPD